MILLSLQNKLFLIRCKWLLVKELNGASAVQVIYCRDVLGIPNGLLNLDGGSVSIGHYGMSGSRMTGHALIKFKRRGENR